MNFKIETKEPSDDVQTLRLLWRKRCECCGVNIEIDDSMVVEACERGPEDANAMTMTCMRCHGDTTFPHDALQRSIGVICPKCLDNQIISLCDDAENAKLVNMVCLVWAFSERAAMNMRLRFKCEDCGTEIYGKLSPGTRWVREHARSAN